MGCCIVRMTSMASLVLPNTSVRLMLEVLAEAGLDCDAAVAQSHLPRALIENPAGEVTGMQELAFQRAFHSATAQRPDLWIELGSRFRLLSHGHSAFGLALATAPNIQEMFEFVVETDHLHHTLCRAFLFYTKDGQISGFGTDLAEVPQDLKQFTMVRDFAATIPVFRDLWGEDFPFDAIETEISPAYHGLISTLTTAEIHAGKPVNRWRWSPSIANRSLQNSNAHLHHRQRLECRALIDSALRSRDVVALLDRYFAEHGTLKPMSRVAGALGMSSRTLQRRLTERGTTFRELVEQWRHVAACEMLVSGRDRIASIAWQVGYANVSSFNHAFKRRAGIVPTEYRHGHRAN